MGAEPFNPVACGLPVQGDRNTTGARHLDNKLVHVQRMQSLHRDLMTGGGFFNTLVAFGEDKTADEVQMSAEGYNNVMRLPRSQRLFTVKPFAIPQVGLFCISDEESDDGSQIKWDFTNTEGNLPQLACNAYANQIFQQILPNDRTKFIKYVSSRPMGLALITGFTGSGKTQVLALTICGMVKNPLIGKVYCTAPTNVAVSNIASRIHSVGHELAVNMINLGTFKNCPILTAPFVVRACNLESEVTAFMKIMASSNEFVSDAISSDIWTAGSAWNLHLSPVWWLLRFLDVRVEGIPHLMSERHASCPSAIYDLYLFLQDRSFLVLWELAAGRTTTGNGGNLLKERHGEVREVVKRALERIVLSADVVCTTPHLATEKGPFQKFNTEIAQACAIDEGGAMNRPSCLNVWGNTGRPMVIAGDDKQLKPPVMTALQKDSDGNLVNLFAPDGEVSILEWFKHIPWDVFILSTQRRMVKGLFDLVANTVYPEVEATYADNCEFSEEKNPRAVEVEGWIQQRYRINSPPGMIQPLFIHCVGSECEWDGLRSSYNNGQNAVTQAVLLDLVEKTSITGNNIILLTPYQANLSRMRALLARNPKLSSIECYTVDSFQGHEADIAVYVFCTTAETGPRFTKNRNRLTVAFTRGKCGLIIVGDKDVLHKMSTLR